MAYTYVGSAASPSTSATITYTATAGNLLVVMTGTSSGGGNPFVTTLTDTGSGTWTGAFAAMNTSGNTFNDGGGNFVGAFYQPNCAGGITSVTAAYNGGTPGTASIYIVEYSGVANTTPLIIGGHNSQNIPTTAPNAVTSNNVNITSQPALLLGLVSTNNLGTNTLTAGTSPTAFTSRRSGTAGSGNFGYLIQDARITSTGNVAVTATDSAGASSRSTAMALAFAEAGGGGGTTPALVQTTSATNSGTGSTVTLTLSGVALGNQLVVAGASQSSSSTIPSIPTDSNGAFTSAISKGPQGTGTGVFSCIWHQANTAAGTHTVVVTIPSTSRPSYFTLTEFSNMAVFVPFDTSAGAGHDDSTQSITVTTPVTGQSQEIIIAVVGVASSVGSSNAAITSPPSGYTTIGVSQNDTNTTNIGCQVSYLLTAGTGAQTATWTWTDVNTIGSAGAMATYRSNAPVATWVFYRPAIQFVDESVIQH